MITPSGVRYTGDRHTGTANGSRLSTQARGEQDEAKRHLKRARELAQVTGSARQRRRIRELSKRIAKAA